MSFPSIRIEGSILSGELLARLDSADFPGQRHGDFSFDSAVRLKEDILRAWTHAQNAWRMHNDRLEAPPVERDDQLCRGDVTTADGVANERKADPHRAAHGNYRTATEAGTT